MPTIVATYSGLVGTSTGTHDASRDATSGTAEHEVPSGLDVEAIMYVRATKGGVSYNINRSFYYFDTTSIITPVYAAGLQIRGALNNTATEVIALKSTAYGGDGQSSLANADFDALEGFTAGQSMESRVTAYTSPFSSWDGSGDNNMTLNATALTDMLDNNFLIVAIVDGTYDYKDNDPGSNVAEVNGAYFHNQAYEDRRPRLSYTLAHIPTSITLQSGLIKLESGMMKIT